MEYIDNDAQLEFTLIQSMEELEYDLVGSLNFFCKNYSCK